MAKAELGSDGPAYCNILRLIGLTMRSDSLDALLLSLNMFSFPERKGKNASVYPRVQMCQTLNVVCKKKGSPSILQVPYC